MANESYIGIAMGLDVTDLKAGLSEANKQIQLANSEFKSASSGLEDWTKSTDGLNAKITQLSTVLDLQKRKLAGIQAEYDKTVASQGANSEAARKLKVQLNNQKAVVNTTERELNNYKDTLKQAKEGTLDLETATLRGGKAVAKLGNDAKKSGDGFTVAKGALAGFIANGLTALVGACKNAVSSILGVVDATKEYRKTLATLDTAANDVGVSTDFIRDKFTSLMGVLGDEASVTEGLNNLLIAGFDESSLDNITKSLEGASLKWKNTLKFEGLADSLQEWIGSSGENLSGNFAELLERMGYSLEEVKEKTAGMTDEQRRNYAMNLLNKEGLDKVSESYRKQNEDMIKSNEANVNWQNTLSKVADKIQPITTKIREGFTKILEKILELTNNVDFDALGEKISKAFDGFINKILPAIIKGLQWIIDNKNVIISGIVGIGAAFVAWKVVGIIQAATKALQGMTIAQKLLNVAMNANPIGIIITLISALVSAFIYFWNTSEEFRNFWINLWNQIKEVCAPVIEFIKSAFILAWKNIKAVWDVVVSYFKTLWENIKLIFSVVKSILTGDFEGAWEGIKNVFSNVKEFFTGVWDKIKEVFSNVGEWFKDVGKNIVTGIWEGIKGAYNWLKEKITGWVGNVAGWFKNVFKIHSPSKLMRDEVGKYVGQGVGVGIVDSLPDVKKNINKFTNFVSDNMGNIKSDISDFNVSDTLSSRRNAQLSQSSKVVTNNNGLTINYNGSLSRKQIRKTEDDYYRSIKLKLKAEGLV